MNTIPRFYRDQIVRFVGGQGTIRSYHPESGSWKYLVEMEMGTEPDIGRIGHETTIVLLESDLIGLE